MFPLDEQIVRIYVSYKVNHFFSLRSTSGDNCEDQKIGQNEFRFAFLEILGEQSIRILRLCTKPPTA